MAKTKSVVSEPMTPTDIDREIGTLFDKFLSGEATEKDERRYQQLLEHRARHLVVMPIVRSHHDRQDGLKATPRSVLTAAVA